MFLSLKYFALFTYSVYFKVMPSVYAGAIWTVRFWVVAAPEGRLLILPPLKKKLNNIVNL